MPKISVIVPVYNCINYIGKCAESLFQQVLDDVEFIFIDDCSTDGSAIVLNEIVKKQTLSKQARTKLIKTPKNLGQAEVRKIGLREATGDYLIHCDSDDWFSPNAFDKLYEVAIEQNADIVIFDYCEVGKDIVIKQGCITPDKKEVIRDVLETRVSCTVWNKCFKRSLLANSIIEPVANVAEDLLLVVQLLFYAENIIYINEPLYNYNISSMTSITSAKGRDISISKFNQIYKNIQKLDSFWEINGVREYSNSMIHLKNKKREIIAPYTASKTVYKMWLLASEGINYRVLLSNRISFNDKVKFLLTFFHLWPLLCAIKKRKRTF